MSFADENISNNVFLFVVYICNANFNILHSKCILKKKILNFDIL